METKGSEKLFFIEHDESQIIGGKLPTNEQVLRVLFYNPRKVESLYQEWKTLQKTCKRRTPLQETRDHDFFSKMDGLFDIAHADALDTIVIEEDKAFVVNQRKKERPGSMIGRKKELFRKEKYERSIQEGSVELELSSSENEEELIEDSIYCHVEDSIREFVDEPGYR